jgi:hypothetical protein
MWSTFGFGAFEIANEVEPQDDVPKLVVASHVTPGLEKVAYVASSRRDQ